MENTPKVSVCIPVYNRAAFIAEAIESVLGQTFTDFELIITDNCSTDGTVDVIRKYISKDSRIRFYVNDSNLGLIGNLNRGILLCRGEYIKYVFSDDKIAPECLKVFVNVLNENPSVSLVTSFTKAFGKSNQLRDEKFFPGIGLLDGKIYQKDLLLNGNWVGSHSSVMFRGKDLHVGLFNQALTACSEDLEMWTKLLGVGDAYVVPEILSYLRIHDEQHTVTGNTDFGQIKTRLILPKIAFCSPNLYGNFTKKEQRKIKSHLLERLIREGIGVRNLRLFLLMIKIGFSDPSYSRIKFCVLLIKNLRRLFKKSRFSK